MRDNVCQSKLPRAGVALSDLTPEEIAGLQGWTLADLEENREGRLSARQKERLLAGTPDLFGLVHARIASKRVIERGIVDIHEGVAQRFERATSTGPSMVLEVDGETLLWSDRETFRGTPESHAVLDARAALLAMWVSERRRVRAYTLSFSLVAFESVTA